MSHVDLLGHIVMRPHGLVDLLSLIFRALTGTTMPCYHFHLTGFDHLIVSTDKPQFDSSLHHICMATIVLSLNGWYTSGILAGARRLII